MPVGVVLDDQGAVRVGTQTLAPLRGKLGGELEAARALDGLDGDLEIGERLLVGDTRVGEHEGADGDLARAGRADPVLLGEDDLVEVRGHRDVRRVADHLVFDVPLVVGRVALREVEGSGHDPHARVSLRETAAEVFEMRPVVPVESLAHLRRHVGQVEGLVHGGLPPLRIGCGNLVASVVAGPVVILQFCSELFWHALVF